MSLSQAARDMQRIARIIELVVIVYLAASLYRYFIYAPSYTHTGFVTVGLLLAFIFMVASLAVSFWDRLIAAVCTVFAAFCLYILFASPPSDHIDLTLWLLIALGLVPGLLFFASWLLSQKRPKSA